MPRISSQQNGTIFSVLKNFSMPTLGPFYSPALSPQILLSSLEGPACLFLNWYMVDLQGCVNFNCIAKWISYIYTYVHSLDSFPITEYWVDFPALQFSCWVVSNSLWPHESQHARPPCPSPTPGVYQTHVHRVSDAIQPSHPVTPFSSCPQSLPASESFPMSQLFSWGGQSTGVSALASVLPKKCQGWSPSEWTGWVSLQSKGLSRVFSNATVQKHQFFGAQLSSQSNSHIHTWPQEKP